MDESNNVSYADNLKRFMNTRREAASFKVEKRGLNREDLREECCETSCVYEERAEFAEEHGHDWVGKKLCELSISEWSVQKEKTKICKGGLAHLPMFFISLTLSSLICSPVLLFIS